MEEEGKEKKKKKTFGWGWGELIYLSAEKITVSEDAICGKAEVEMKAKDPRVRGESCSIKMTCYFSCCLRYTNVQITQVKLYTYLFCSQLPPVHCLPLQDLVQGNLDRCDK